MIGLTGGIATGKSTVSALLAKEHNFPIIDADILAREAVQPNTRALAKIVSHFGPSVLLPDGSLDRTKLGSIIFADDQARRALNAIVHPAVSRAIFWRVVSCWVRGESVCVVEVPLLIEGGLWRLMALVVVVHWSASLPPSSTRLTSSNSSPETQLNRLTSRDASTPSAASARIASQLPVAQKLPYADYPIPNDAGPDDLRAHVDAFVVHVQSLLGAGVWWRLCWLIPPLGVLAALAVITSRNWNWWRKTRRRSD